MSYSSTSLGSSSSSAVPKDTTNNNDNTLSSSSNNSSSLPHHRSVLPQPNHNPMPLTRPRIVIPAVTVAEASAVPVITPKTTTTDNHHNKEENVGRWSEQEHHIFLQGLAEHGKQWKLIAGMIGSRTVVQVRTHAQKYFQRMDRQRKAITAKPRKIKKRAERPTVLPNFPRSVSHASSENDWGAAGAAATISPVSCDDDDDDSSMLVLDPLVYCATTVATQFVATTTTTAQQQQPDYLEFQQQLGQDPLEWLMDAAEPSMLPESSLPVFPELADPSATVSDDEAVDVALNNMVDPNVTLQSLFAE